MDQDNSLAEIEAVETAEQYQIQSEINDMRQHANKIIQGLKKLNQHDANRAIWELFQNAVDLSANSLIEIVLREDALIFRHNGAPFTPMTLDCLFKQVSSKTLEEKKVFYEKEDPVGQYGTGFMTAHVFGKELVINGAVAKGQGYIPLTNFVIDRRTDNWKVLAKAIRDLKVEVTQLLDRYNDPLPLPYPKTEFTFKFANEQNKIASTNAVESLLLILPYVMALNPNLAAVEVTGINGSKTVYTKGEAYPFGELMVRPVKINDAIQEICYIETSDKKTTIILPLNKDLQSTKLDSNLPRLFLYYPLIGTETFGCNFVFHSRQFQPVEPRNALHLASDNDSNTKDELQNQMLIKNASERIFEFLKKHADKILNRINLSAINFKIDSEDDLLNKYFIGLKSAWIDSFKDLPLVETINGSLAPISTEFLDSWLINTENGFESTYPIAKLFFPAMPREELICDWTSIMEEWKLSGIRQIIADDIAKKIESAAIISKFDNREDLKKFYQFLILNDKGLLFNSHRLLPNIFGDFRFLMGNEGLNQPQNITSELIEIANVIMPEVPKRHVDKDFIFSLELPDYTRKNYAAEILEAISSKITDNTISQDLETPYLEALIDYCKLSTSITSVSVPTEMVKLISRLFKKPENLILLEQLEDDKLDIRSVQRKLVRLALNDISKKEQAWVIDNQTLLHDILSLSGYDAYEEIFNALPVFPNQLNELCKQVILEIDAPIPDEIKDMFDKVTKPNLPIRYSLVNNAFAGLLKVQQKRTVRSTTEKIESIFFGESDLINLNDHPFRQEILGIVENFKANLDYPKYYPLIYAQRSAILVNLADGEDSFAILSMPPKKINELAKLASDPNFDQIVALGRSALLAQQHENANFQHKYMLGRHIENILRRGLINILADEVTADVKDVQDGQDIIISIAQKPIYYIEVKSRWDKENPIRMSKNQTKKAYAEKNNYALCSVDLTLYIGTDPMKVENIEEVSECMFFSRDIGEKVQHLIGILEMESQPDLINLDGDFRTRIPMNYVITGENLGSFEAYLLQFVQQEVDKAKNTQIGSL